MFGRFATTVALLFLVALNVVSGTITCDDPFSCNATTLTETDGSITCDSFAACLGTTISLTNIGNNSDSRYLRCRGSRSCQSTTSVSAVSDAKDNSDMQLLNYGYLAMAWAEEVYVNTDPADAGLGTSSGLIECEGEASCYGINTISSSYLIKCSGVQSCGSIGGANVTILQAYGTFSLLGSTFYSFIPEAADDSETSIFLYGYYSGYGATYYCKSGYTCSVDCGINGCINFDYYCEDGATCSVSCDDDDTICPNGWSNGVYTGEFGLFDSDNYTFSVSNDLIQTYLTKTYSEDVNYDLINNCIDSESIESDIGCDTDDSSGCFQETFSVVNGSLCVNGELALLSTSFDVVGDESTLFCDGDSSCAGTIGSLNGNDMYCRGYGSCAGTSNFGSIVATSGSSFYRLEADGGDTLYCLGGSSCAYMDISGVSTIYAAGFFSLDVTEITSDGNDLDVYLLGELSGDVLTITCSGTDTCTIYRLDNSYDLYQVGCDSSDTCTINIIFIEESLSDGPSSSSSSSASTSDPPSDGDDNDDDDDHGVQTGSEMFRWQCTLMVILAASNIIW